MASGGAGAADIHYDWHRIDQSNKYVLWYKLCDLCEVHTFGQSKIPFMLWTVEEGWTGVLQAHLRDLVVYDGMERDPCL